MARPGNKTWTPYHNRESSEGGNTSGNKNVVSSQASANLSIQQPLAPRTGKSKTVQSELHSFLDLPGEIRNKVYEYVFDSRRVVIRKAHGRKKLEEGGASISKTKLPNVAHEESQKGPTLEPSKPYQGLYVLRTIMNGKVFKRGDTKGRVNIDLLFTCRRVYEEGICYLYASTTFWFGSFKPIRRLLRNCRPDALGAIKHLEIYHVIYGEPALTVDREWKMRDDDRWMDVCSDMSEKLTGLQTLRLDLRICDWPTQLNLAASWAQPILKLGERKFLDVRATLIHPCFKAKHLSSAANVLEEAMMCDAGVEKRRVAKALKDVEEQKRRELEKEQQEALESMPAAERIEWEAMIAEAEAEEKAKQQAATPAPKILKITFPKSSHHCDRQAARVKSNVERETEASATAEPSTAGAKKTDAPGKKNTIAKGQTHEGGYHGHRPRKEQTKSFDEMYLPVAMRDERTGRWINTYIPAQPMNW